MSLVIGIDCRPLLSRPTGVGVYLAGLLGGLAVVDPENRYVLFSSSLRERFDSASLPPLVHHRLVDRRVPVRVLNYVWHHFGRPGLDRLCGETLDLTHSPHPLILPARRARKIVTIHDLFFLTHPDRVEREMSSQYPSLVRGHAKRADGILTVSEYSKVEIVARLGVSPDKVRVVYHGAPPPRPKSASGLARDSILFVGRIEHRKNVGGLLRAFAAMENRDAMLRLVGPPGAGFGEFLQQVAALGIGQRVALPGYKIGADLAAEYERARVFVLPSFCEGFGLPLLDAMSHRIAIAASNVTAIPEIAGGAAAYFDPQSPEEMSRVLDRLWSDEAEREQLARAGLARLARFSWEDSARQTLDFYRAVAGRS